MKCAIFDLGQEYWGPAKVLCRGAAASPFASSDFGDGRRSGIKRTALGDIVNLKRFRKSKVRSEADRQATTNRALFGRTRAERERDEQEQKQLSDVLDQ